ncbi:MAG TPA: Gfo/Idh/MocA family oxidoreductase [Limnochordia bacterium]
MEALKVGLIGLGGRGSSLLRTLRAMSEVRVTAVADVAPDRVQAAAQGETAGFETHTALLMSGLVEAVVIATPHPFHAEIAVAAARQGLHVLCEKPMAVRVSEADDMIEAARSAGVVLALMFNRRAEPAHRKARELIEEIGPIHEVEMISTAWYRLQSYYDSGAWRATWRGEGGGILANQAPHDLDLLVWLAGLPKRVKATLRRRIHRIETENTVLALLEYPAGATGIYKATTADPAGVRRVEIAGERGRIKLEGGKLWHCRYPQPLSEHILHAPDRRSAPFPTAWEEVALPERTDSTRAIIEQFVRAIRLGEAPIATGEDGRRALELANALHLAGLTESPVEIPVDRSAVDALYAELAAGRRALVG